MNSTKALATAYCWNTKCNTWRICWRWSG
ncbi:MAG: hypothetical protein H7Z72_00645 [Bacteroidetes bacterium]|nr:hypothetical protein [Fibrella sp.]